LRSLILEIIRLFSIGQVLASESLALIKLVVNTEEFFHLAQKLKSLYGLLGIREIVQKLHGMQLRTEFIISEFHISYYLLIEYESDFHFAKLLQQVLNLKDSDVWHLLEFQVCVLHVIDVSLNGTLDQIPNIVKLLGAFLSVPPIEENYKSTQN